MNYYFDAFLSAKHFYVQALHVQFLVIFVLMGLTDHILLYKLESFFLFDT